MTNTGRGCIIREERNERRKPKGCKMTRQEIMLNEYRNRIEVADNVLSETRAKLTKAEHDRDRYKAEIERLKSQQQEIDRLKAENRQLKTECALLDDELRIARQETIDVLNKLKAENEELSKVVSSKVYDLIDNTKEIADAREAWEQQAKIDVLNELWEKVKDKGVDYKIGMRALSEEIDELIKGV